MTVLRLGCAFQLRREHIVWQHLSRGLPIPPRTQGKSWHQYKHWLSRKEPPPQQCRLACRSCEFLGCTERTSCSQKCQDQQSQLHSAHSLSSPGPRTSRRGTDARRRCMVWTGRGRGRGSLPGSGCKRGQPGANRNPRSSLRMAWQHSGRHQSCRERRRCM